MTAAVEGQTGQKQGWERGSLVRVISTQVGLARGDWAAKCWCGVRDWTFLVAESSALSLTALVEVQKPLPGRVTH